MKQRIFGWITTLFGIVMALAVMAFVATAVAGAFGAMLNKFAPVRGGTTIVIMKGETHG